MHSILSYINQNYLIVILLTIVLLLLFLLLRYKLIGYLKARKTKKRFKRGNKLELQAESFLKSKGYTILAYQATYKHKYIINGEVQCAEIQPDYIVRKNGKQYIVEVKSGTSAITARNRNTRRQLLEYDYAIENDGVFLLDMESKKLQLIQFKSKAERHSNTLLKITIILAITGIALPYWQPKVFIALTLIVIFFIRRL